MKRSFRLPVALSVGVLTLLAAAPAFAEEYMVDDGAAAGVFCGIYACIGVFGIISLVFWIWMLVDLIGRQEYEFPNSTGNSKTTWLIIMFASWVIGLALVPAVIYYFMVFKKIKRGSLQPPSPVGYQPPVAPAPTYPAAPPAPTYPAAPPAPTYPAAPPPPAPPAAPPAPPAAPAAPPAEPPAPPAPPATPQG